MKVEQWDLAANLSLLFTELPMLERPAAAAESGFGAVEVWWPFSTYAPDRREVDAFVEAILDSGVELVAMNLFAGDMRDGDRGISNDSARYGQFLASVTVAREVGLRTGCKLFNALYGNRIAGTPEAGQKAAATKALIEGCRQLDQIAGTLLIESLNADENGDYLLTCSDDAGEIVGELRAAGCRVAMLADLYHWMAGGEDIVSSLRRHRDLIAHVQLAGFPGRHEPDLDNHAVSAALGELSTAGYVGVIAAEYRPSTTTVAGLTWVPPINPNGTSHG